MTQEIDPNEFWEGHSFKDGCSWKKELGLSLKFPFQVSRMFYEMYAYFFRDRKYFDQVKAFYAIKPDLPFKRLSAGQEFNTADYPRGTILRISKVMSLNPRHLGNYNLWGIIEQEMDLDDKWIDQIIAFPQHHLTLPGRPPSGYIAYRNFHNPFTVGEVIHDREKVLFLPTQSLTRYDEVDIWKYGLGVREVIPEKAPKLVPQPRRIIP